MNDVVKSVKNDSKEKKDLIPYIPKDALKSLFYMVTGKPDSKYRVFKKKVLIDNEDIINLNTKIIDKLKIYDIEEIISSLTVSFEKDQSIDFGTWAEFLEYDWIKPYTTKELTIRWEFLINVPNYQVPQKHTLNVKISHPLNPREFFQILISQDPEDDDKFNETMGVCVARVDFIHHRLADELIDIVREWNETLNSPTFKRSWFQKLEKNDKTIARLIHFSVPGIFSVVVFAFISYLDIYWRTNSLMINDIITDSLKLILVSSICLFLMNRLGIILANRCFKAINNYG